MSNADLEYAGRERKRPPGASHLVQRIYVLLHEHPQGMTRDEIHAELREGWLETDAYRSYHNELAKGRKSVQHGGRGARIEYGTPEFKKRAQRAWIRKVLAHMAQYGTAHREEDRWFAGRAPRVTSEAGKRYYTRLDEATIKARKADTEAHVRREQVKAELLTALNDPRTTKKRYQELARLAYEYISGR